jgi:hypothetical protein
MHVHVVHFHAVARAPTAKASLLCTTQRVARSTAGRYRSPKMPPGGARWRADRDSPRREDARPPPSAGSAQSLGLSRRPAPRHSPSLHVPRANRPRPAVAEEAPPCSSAVGIEAGIDYWHWEGTPCVGLDAAPSVGFPSVPKVDAPQSAGHQPGESAVRCTQANASCMQEYSLVLRLSTADRTYLRF